jgi:hypothetical protein
MIFLRASQDAEYLHHVGSGSIFQAAVVNYLPGQRDCRAATSLLRAEQKRLIWVNPERAHRR